jgi:predicted nucleic acid-binding protein
VTAPAREIYVLDTSALLALIEDEPGADRVEDLLRAAVVLLPFVVGLEVSYISAQERSADEADRRLALLRRLPVHWLASVPDTVLVTAGMLKAQHRLSLADALIAAFAADAGAILVHKDPEYEALAAAVRQERLPYKLHRRDQSFGRSTPYRTSASRPRASGWLAIMARSASRRAAAASCVGRGRRSLAK